MVERDFSLVSVEWLAEHKGDKNVKLLDVSYSLKPKGNHEEFIANSYAKFEKLIGELTNADYLSEHIAGAVHYNLDVAHYPGQFERFGLYPSELFEQYVQRLGINGDDHVVLCGRGPAAGMLFAARAWWTLKAYGLNRVSVLNGGLDAWKAKGGAVESGNVPAQMGNWKAQPLNQSMFVSFEALTTKGVEGESVLDTCEQINYLDARSKEHFSGDAELGFPAPHATGSHVRGAKNVPLATILGPGGMNSKEEVDKTLASAGFVKGRETVVACNGGVQAAVVALALHRNGHEVKLYNGSMLELAARASHLINGGNKKK